MKKLTFIAAATLMLTACSDNTAPQAQAPSQPALMQQQQQQAPQPVQAAQAPQQVVVQQAPAQHSSTSDMLLGGALGYMLGSAGNRQAAPAPAPTTTVVHKTIVNKTVVQQAPAPAVKPVEPPKKVTPPPAPAPAPAPARVAPAPSSYKPATTTYSGSGASSYHRK